MAGVFLFHCSPVLKEWLSSKLDTCCIVLDERDLEDGAFPMMLLLSFVVVVDRVSTSKDCWIEYIELRRKLGADTNFWLLLIGDIDYANPEDKKVIRVRSSREALNAITGLIMSGERVHGDGE